MLPLLITKRLWQLLPIALAVCAWEMAVRLSGNELVPTPSTALKAMFDLAAGHVLLQDCYCSLKRVLVGFAIASMAGVFLGFCFGLSSFVRAALSPIVELLRPIPPIAWIPVAITLFGIGDASSAFVIFMGAFYPILTNTFLGVSEVSTNYIEAASVLGATPGRIYRDVIFPAALPSIFAGLRVGLGVAWMCVVAAEMIAARSGLGYEIQLNRQLLQLDRVVAGMIVIGLIGVIMNQLMGLLECYLVPWKQISSVPPDRATVSLITKKAGAVTSPAVLHDPIVGATVQIENVSFAYPSGANIVSDLNLSIACGESFCLLGETGCGKTTILRLIAGLRRPTSGVIQIDRGSYEAHRGDVTVVFQNAALFPWLTVFDNVAFGLRSRGLHGQAVSGEVAEHLEMAGVSSLVNRYPNELSGGQQQRVALARALAYRPRIIVMDEPFSALDSQTRESLQQDVLELVSALRITLVLVTHDIREAIFMSDRIGVMSSTNKTILQEFIVGQPRPRDDDFRYRPEFGNLRKQIWDCLHSEKNATNEGREQDVLQQAKI